MRHLAAGAGLSVDEASVRVRPMPDGGMGSLQFSSETPSPHRHHAIGAAEFEDDDGVLVLAELTVDQDGQLFELDLWKVDFSPLKRWPMPEELRSPGVDARRPPR
ncbi:MAG: hypothetical protein IPM35_15085 [Myxococcales bacterium]|nr:hypothetical protein [Myxococcales bacterium]